MDWKYILSVSPETLDEEEKDDLYNKIAWYDCDSEKLDRKTYIALVKISQEIMKFKSEQVEALIAELDEVAARQAENEARKQGSLDDLHSLKSQGSSTYSDNVEQKKYKDVKLKLKQQIKQNEIQMQEIEKMQYNMSVLEQEKLHLQMELKSMLTAPDDNQSDVSDSITADHYKELVQLMQQKNKQITELLNDIQVVESENLELKENVANLRDKLDDATQQVSLITNDFTSTKIKLQDHLEQIKALSEENEALRSQIKDFTEDKYQRDDQINEFTTAIDRKIDDWKKVLQNKNEEIDKLKSKVRQTSLQSSQSSLSMENDKNYGDALNKIINEREEQIVSLQTQLQTATKEMDKSTQLIQQLTFDKNAAVQKIDESMICIANLKSQLRASHERCQNLQEDVSYAENMSESKQENLNDILTKLKADGQIELSQSLEQIHKLKIQARLKDKQISDYVKLANRLQNSMEYMENENCALRDKCGIPADKDVDINGVLIKKCKQGKEQEHLQKQINVLEEEKLNLKGELQKVTRKLSIASSQILNSGGKFNIDTGFESDITASEVQQPADGKQKFKQKYRELLEENEALRKGLHEILQSVQTKNESTNREMKSDTLEKLLQALDVRHVSGWYHPAMRLQAELHSLQGVNIELREQLRLARLNADNVQNNKEFSTINTVLKRPLENQTNITSSTMDKALNFSNRTPNVLNSDGRQEVEESGVIQTLEEYKKNYESAEQQINIVYDQYVMEKKLWTDKESLYEADKRTLEDNVAILDAKLKEFAATHEDEYKKIERFAETSGNIVKLNRKCVFLENQESKLSCQVKNLQNDLESAQKAALRKISALRTEKNDLLGKLVIRENFNKNSINRLTHVEVQNNLNALTLKYRDLLNNFNTIRTDYSNEIVTSKETVKLIEEQKAELRNKLLNVFTNIHVREAVSVTDGLEILAKKLAQSEITELAEKQRANHMSNLYELVKEQLQKSEVHLQECEKYNQEIVRNNITLQESIVNLENKVINYVDTKEHQELERKYKECLEEKQQLSSDIDKLKDLSMIANKSATQTNSLPFNDFEVLNLKHQILDLQASGDDKALIARLSSDVVLARLSETQCHKKLDELESELKECQYTHEAYMINFKHEQKEKENCILHLQNKISDLEDVIQQQRQQYLGCIPLISQEIFNVNLQHILKDKQLEFQALQNILKHENECLVLKDQLNRQIQLEGELTASFEDNGEKISKKLNAWHQERNTILLKELKYERELDFKIMQLEQFTCRLNSQDDLITKLQEEILLCYQRCDPLPLMKENENSPTVTEIQLENMETVIGAEIKLLKQQETQTTPELLKTSSDEGNLAIIIANLQCQVNASEDEVKQKSVLIEQLRSKINELEMNVSLFRTQIGDKQSQIAFYEKHILELQNKISKLHIEPTSVDYTNSVIQSSEEILVLKDALKELQENNVQKDTSILKYQTLLKKDRDEHSLAAARMQEEVKLLQELIATQEKAYKDLKESSVQHPGRAAIEQYILQVHALERHTADLHTTVSTLNSQLQASRQEASRWQSLANERLDSMEQLRNDIEEQHQQEIATYKRESDRWREEIIKQNELVSRYRTDKHVGPDINKILKDRDDKIQELNISLKQVKNEARKQSEKTDTLSKISELECVKEQLMREHDALKKRYEQVLSRERSAKDEIRNLKEQLLKRPLSSARSDKTEKEQLLQKKMTTQEKEIEDLKSKLEKQLVINEGHRVAVTEDFEKWKKQKYWQQMTEKLKVKLNEKSDAYEKLHQTCAGYKILIERLEREKHNLENRIKNLRHSHGVMDTARSDVLNFENEKLHFENQALSAKLQMQHHHSGGLGASLMQEKLEAQERKIAFLELTSKGSGELRTEMERLQKTSENMHKMNLRLEAENLELKLDLERYGKDVPHLREQIEYLENYIDILKSENQAKHTVTESGDHGTQKNDKKVAELERTVFVLKRIVEKLQVENKRLQGGTSRPCSSTDRSGSSDKLRIDYQRLKEQYGGSIQQIAALEDKLKLANSKIALLEKRPLTTEIASLSAELSRAKADLFQKSELLEKVKVLLHRAAIKEKAFLDEIAALKLKIPLETQTPKPALS